MVEGEPEFFATEAIQFPPDPQWSPQNRPTVVTPKPANGAAQDRIILSLPEAWQARDILRVRPLPAYTDRDRTEDRATRGRDPSADSGA